MLEQEDDKIAYDRFNEMKLVNIKATMMKAPDDRSAKEVEYICLWLRQNFEVFLDIEKQDVGVLMKRLSINNYLPGQRIAMKGKPCDMMTLLVDGKIDGYANYDPEKKVPGGVDRNVVTETYNAVCSIGQECFFKD